MLPAPADASYPLQVGHDLLNAVSAAIDGGCDPLPDMCGKRVEYVGWNAVGDVLTCPLLAVYITNAGKDQAPVTQGNASCVWRNRFTFRVEYWVCVPVNDPLDPNCAAVSDLVYQHEWQAYHGLLMAFKNGEVRDLDACTQVSFGDLQPFSTQGGCGGASFTVTLFL